MDWITLLLQVLLTLALHVSYTSPNPTADRKENTMSTGYELRLNFFGPLISRTGFWVLGIAEVVSLAVPQLNIPYLTSTNIHLTPLSILGFLCIFGGALIRYQCYRTLGKFFTFERSFKRDHVLVTSGPYSVVRHPGYFGSTLNTVGMVLWWGSPGSWVRESGVLETFWGRVALGMYFSVLMAILATLIWRMPKEEAMLKDAFGKQWDEWAQRVPYMLFPGIF
ncbi:hypothetical protein BD779DRAFT_1622666 [Infundibulicybe gibba]|nr:hypothetical protein BD779DRAFT_1622666 [Infundibulicybe gibba]